MTTPLIRSFHGSGDDHDPTWMRVGVTRMLAANSDSQRPATGSVYCETEDYPLNHIGNNEYSC